MANEKPNLVSRWLEPSPITRNFLTEGTGGMSVLFEARHLLGIWGSSKLVSAIESTFSGLLSVDVPGGNFSMPVTESDKGPQLSIMLYGIREVTEEITANRTQGFVFLKNKITADKQYYENLAKVIDETNRRLKVQKYEVELAGAPEYIQLPSAYSNLEIPDF